MSDKYEVGYRKPPKHGQFQEGQSGNPKGRRKGKRNFSTDVKRALRKTMRVRENGKLRTVLVQEAVIMLAFERALKGNARALDVVLALAQNLNDAQVDADKSGTLSGDDAEILAALKQGIAESLSKDVSADPAPETTNDNDAEDSDNG